MEKEIFIGGYLKESGIEPNSEQITYLKQNTVKFVFTDDINSDINKIKTIIDELKDKAIRDIGATKYTEFVIVYMYKGRIVKGWISRRDLYKSIFDIQNDESTYINAIKTLVDVFEEDNTSLLTVLRAKQTGGDKNVWATPEVLYKILHSPHPEKFPINVFKEFKNVRPFMMYCIDNELVEGLIWLYRGHIRRMFKDGIDQSINLKEEIEFHEYLMNSKNKDKYYVKFIKAMAQDKFAVLSLPYLKHYGVINDEVITKHRLGQLTQDWAAAAIAAELSDELEKSLIISVMHCGFVLRTKSKDMLEKHIIKNLHLTKDTEITTARLTEDITIDEVNYPKGTRVVVLTHPNRENQKDIMFGNFVWIKDMCNFKYEECAFYNTVRNYLKETSKLDDVE